MTTPAKRSPPVDNAILCKTCCDNGSFGTMWPGGDHDDDPTWGVAEVLTDPYGEWVITWRMTGLTVAQAEAY